MYFAQFIISIFKMQHYFYSKEVVYRTFFPLIVLMSSNQCMSERNGKTRFKQWLFIDKLLIGNAS